MARFVFQLEALLRHREHEERQRQRDLAVAEAQTARLSAELRKLDEEARASVEDVRKNHLIGPLNLQFLASHRRYLLATQRKAMTLAQRMALQQRQLEQARAALAEAAKQRKILEKLREKRHRQWAQEVARREFAELDDVGMRLSAWSDDPAGGGV